MDKKPEKLVPEVRFKGFTDDWEQRKLRDVANLNGRIGFRGYTRKDIVNKDKGILAFSPTNIVSNKLIKTSKDTYITVKKYDESPEIKLKNGYVLFVKTGSTLGKSALIKELSQPATVNPQIVVIKPERINASFMSIILLNDKVQRQVFSRKIGGAVPTLTENEINNFNFNIPKTTEQQSISEIIECLNNFLSLQQRKLEQLMQLKKAMLQQLFTDKNSKQPILRFKSFSGDWEQHKLKDISIIIAGGDKNKDKLKKIGNYPVIANAVNSDGVVGYYDDSYRIEAPAITVTGRGDIGHATPRYLNFTPVVRLLALKTKHDVLFLANAINKITIFNESTGVPQLTKPQLSKYSVKVTKLNEEKKISKIINTLNKLVTLQQNNLTQLTTLKKYLLQNLFV